jgi:N-acetylglucosaminyl-diphospho-decaprenol L-rhamnosyltransferase
MTGLTTIIVSYNTCAELLDCLQSLQAHPPAGPHEIIVVDNASTDGTVAAVTHRYPTVKLIEPGRNLGFAAANNLGLEAAANDMVLLLNSDTLVPIDALDTLMAELRSTPGLAAIGPRIVDGSGRAELSFGRMLSPWNELRQKAIVTAQARGIRLAEAWVERATRRPSFPDWVSGACLLVWRRDAMEAGRLDERYFLYAEDVDFCAALRGLGKRIRFFPGAQIVHLRGRSGRTRPAVTERLYQQSHLRFYEKHHPRTAALLRLYLRLRRKLPA